MKRFVLYNAQGVIRQACTGDDPPVVPGLSAIEFPHDADPAAWHVKAGELVAGALDTRTLDRAKYLKWREVKAQAKAADEADIALNGHTFAADYASRASLFQKAQIALMAAQDGLAFSVEWEKVDGTVVILNANQCKAIVRAIDARTDSIRATARSLRQQIAAAATVAAVDAVTWPT